MPLPTSSRPVSTADPQLSCGLSRQTRPATYELFTPNNSGQRLRPTYYRGCWHVVSRRFFCRYTSTSSLLKEVYNPKAVIPHAASLRQASAHCAIFPLLPPVGVWACLSPSVAGRPLRPATRRRLGRPLPHQQADRPRAHPQPKNFPPPTMPQEVVSGIRPSFPGLSQSQGQVTHVLLTRSPLEYPEGPFRSTCMC